jgi:hypothetical protein
VIPAAAARAAAAAAARAAGAAGAGGGKSETVGVAVRVTFDRRSGGVPLATAIKDLGAGDGVLSVGLLNTVHAVTRTPLWKIAEWLEFGTKRQEPRPAVSRAIFRHKDKWLNSLRARMARIRKGLDDPAVSMGRLGARMVDDIQGGIATNREIPNAASWKKVKGHDKPWLWTRQLLNSWAWSWTPRPLSTRMKRAMKDARDLDRNWRGEYGNI